MQKMFAESAVLAATGRYLAPDDEIDQETLTPQMSEGDQDRAA